MSQLITATELAPLLHVSAYTVLAWKRSGKITAEIDTGRTILFDADKVVKSLKASKRKPAKANTSGMIPTY